MTDREYEIRVMEDLRIWQLNMQKNPTIVGKLSSKVQAKMNSFIPEKIHKAVTVSIKQMIRLVLFGSKITTKPMKEGSLRVRELLITEKIRMYKKAAAAEGGITGAGGILWGLADFPLLLGIKIKLLFGIVANYGFDTDDYKERIFLLYIFQLAFSSQEKRKEVYEKLENWPETSADLPADVHQFDWRSLQQEYRDYIDIAKMAQLIPVIGAPVGAVVNYRLIQKLGTTAMNACRMRWQQSHLLLRAV